MLPVRKEKSSAAMDGSASGSNCASWLAMPATWRWQHSDKVSKPSNLIEVDSPRLRQRLTVRQLVRPKIQTKLQHLASFSLNEPTPTDSQALL